MHIYAFLTCWNVTYQIVGRVLVLYKERERYGATIWIRSAYVKQPLVRLVYL